MNRLIWGLFLLTCLPLMAGKWGFFPTQSTFSEVHSGDFNGSSSFADAGNVSALDINGGTSGGAPFSISGWFYQTSFASFEELVTKRDVGGTFAGYEIGTSSANFVTDLASGATAKVELTWTTVTLSTNTWYFWVWTNDGTGTVAGTNFYICSAGTCTAINGTAAVSTGISAPIVTTSTAPFRIGTRSNGALFFGGQQDEVAYWNVELSSGTVTTLYNAGTPTDISAISGLVSWWRFENSVLSPLDSSSTIFDRKSSNDLTNTSVGFSTNVP